MTRLVGRRTAARRSRSACRAPLQIERRAADDLEHVGGRGLLLQRFGEIVGALAQFVEQPRVLDGDTAWSAKVLSSAICLSVKGRTSGGGRGWRRSARCPRGASAQRGWCDATSLRAQARGRAETHRSRFAGRRREPRLRVADASGRITVLADRAGARLLEHPRRVVAVARGCAMSSPSHESTMHDLASQMRAACSQRWPRTPAARRRESSR